MEHMSSQVVVIASAVVAASDQGYGKHAEEKGDWIGVEIHRVSPRHLETVQRQRETNPPLRVEVGRSS